MNSNVHPSRRPRLRGLLAVLVASTAVLVAAPAASAEFGLNSFDVTFTNEDGSPAMQAGSHPFAMTSSFRVNPKSAGSPELLDEEFRDAVFEQVAGLVGDSTAFPTCSNDDFFAAGKVGQSFTRCRGETAVGVVANYLYEPFLWVQSPIYNLVPPPGVAVRLGFRVLVVPVVVDVSIKQSGDYNVEASLRNTPQITSVYGSVVQLWGDPTDPRHDPLRGPCGDGPEGEGEVEFRSRGSEVTGCPIGVERRKPFLTVPRSCTGPATSIWRADSWEHPGAWVEGSALTHDDATPPNPQGFTGCGKLGFSPQVEAKPSTTSAETGSGLDFNLDFHDEGLTNPNGLAQSDVKKTEVRLPEGVTLNPSIGEGLGVCSPADIDRELIETKPGDGCPDSSKIGSLHVETQLLDQPVEGQLFLAQQDDPTTSTPGAENPFDSLIAFYMVLRNPEKGIFAKVPAKVEPDPKTGQLVASVDNIPQLPFSHFNLHFREGQRAPLVSPPNCGTYTTEAKLYPWSDPGNPRTVLSSFEITEGVGGGACPTGGVPPFHPDFEAGAINNNAGSFSPFTMGLTRKDGEQDMTKFSAILPPGELGSLAGVSKCPDAAIAIAKAKTGRQELASPSCPANSLIGHTVAGAGVGGSLTYVGGQVYLGGPYKGDPLSVISVTPGVAGPFDAGTVVVRLALTLNPKTAEVEVDGANSDPIPHILKGIILKVRDLRVSVDRPNFTLNPTSCDPSSAKSTLFGSYLDVIDPGDDVPVALSSRFQAANCLNLGFEPKLALNLKGGTKRGGHPGLLATYRTKSGDANLNDLVVRLPRSAFLDQAHIRTICTRVQFAADTCPAAAQYGFIRAWTPLLDDPLEGPVWLRSSNHKLPDLVFDLHGLVDIEVATRIDSARGGIRASLEDLPDAPISKVLLRMQGGKKGLIVNSRNLCGATSKADVQFGGQNGKRRSLRPVMQADCGAKRRAKRASH